MTIGQAIRKARKAKRYSLQKLADESGVAVLSIGNWERGYSFPNVISLLSIADVLQVTLDELVGRTVKNENSRT